MFPRIIIYFIVAINFLSACKKDSGCPMVESIAVAANNTNITKGWNLTLSADFNRIYRCEWEGPNGWTSQVPVPQRTNLQIADGGYYSIKIYNSADCLIEKGTININVSEVLSAPCEQLFADNTVTSNIPGIDNFFCNGLIARFSSGETDAFAIKVGAGINPPQLKCSFNSFPEFKAGLYKTTSYSPSGPPGEGKVVVLAQDGVSAYSYIASSGQDVFVTKVGSKMQVCFCNIRVTGTGGIFSVSARFSDY